MRIEGGGHFEPESTSRNKFEPARKRSGAGRRAVSMARAKIAPAKGIDQSAAKGKHVGFGKQGAARAAGTAQEASEGFRGAASPERQGPMLAVPAKAAA